MRARRTGPTIAVVARGRDIFHLAYGLWLAVAIIAFSSNAERILWFPMSTLTYVAGGVVSVLLVGRAMTLRYTRAEWAFLAACLLVAGVVAIRTGLVVLFLTIIFVVWSRGVPIEDLARTTLRSSVAAIVAVAVLTVSGLATDRVFERGPSGFERHSFGFLHPNTLGMILLNLCLAWFVLSRHRRGPLSALPVFVAIGVNAALLDSRSALGLMLVLLLVWRRASDSTAARILRVTPSLVVLCVATSVAAALAYNPSNVTWAAIDQVLSGRLSLANAYINVYGVQAFGQPVAFGSIVDYRLEAVLAGSRGTVDMGYVSLLLQAGWAGLLIFCALLFVAARSARTHREPTLALAIAVLALSGVFETTVFQLQYAFPLFIAALGFSSPTSLAAEKHMLRRPSRAARGAV